MVGTRSLMPCLVLGLILVLVGVIAWCNRTQEFAGTLRDQRDGAAPAVVGWPKIPARLVTANNWYALEFADVSTWDAFLDQHDGRLVVVRGVPGKWRGKYLRGHLRIRVIDMQPAVPAPTRIPSSQPATVTTGP